jgi:signal transduction histidine kinase
VAWSAGIRIGQRVESITPAEHPGGWAIETSDGLMHYRATRAAADARLRASLPVGFASLGLSLLAVAVCGSSRKRSEAMSAMGAVLAAIPHSLAPSLLGSVAVAAGLVVPTIWIARWATTRPRVRSAVLALGFCAGLGWLATVEFGLAPRGSAVVVDLVAALAAAIVLSHGIGLTQERFLRAVAATRALDAAVLAGLALAAVVLLSAGIHPVIVVVVALLPLGGYARSRKGIAQLADRVLLAELREREAMHATEAERARVSREIHDDPLQTIAGAIAQLDGPLVDNNAVRDSLRGAAARLRALATELHPPVLDDLGLAPAIESLCETVREPGLLVSIANGTGYARPDRPPTDVELAVYRIVAEAIANACRHARATRIDVAGYVRPDEINLAVTDDGVGVTEVDAERAVRTGHIGLSSMRRRAAAIDATLEIDGKPGRGTTIRLRWMR